MELRVVHLPHTLGKWVVKLLYYAASWPWGSALEVVMVQLLLALG